MADGAVEGLPDFLRRDAPQEHGDIVLAELYLETHRVSGIVGQAGAHRRLVDLLNVADAVLTLRDATVRSLAVPDDPPRRCQAIQVRRQAILLAVPLSAAAPADQGTDAARRRSNARPHSGPP